MSHWDLGHLASGEADQTCHETVHSIEARRSQEELAAKRFDATSRVRDPIPSDHVARPIADCRSAPSPPVVLTILANASDTLVFASLDDLADLKARKKAWKESKADS